MDIKVAIWDVAPFVPDVMGVNIKEYYQNVGLKLKTQIKFQQQFPEAILYPGIWPDYGTVVEASAFGCQVRWFEDDAPYASPCINKANQVENIRIPDPYKDGLMPVMLNDYQYMWDNISQDIIEKTGFLKGVGYSLGPLETSGLIMGYDNFFIGMYQNPRQIKELINKVTKGIIKWLKAQEKINGKIQRLYIPDHLPTQISAEFFLEFGLPALQKIFNEFSDATKLWHNEGNVSHISQYIDIIGCDIFHCGNDIKELQQETDHVILMGNLDPLDVMLEGTPDKVINCVQELLGNAPDSERILISSAGGMAPGTPLANISAMFKGIKEYQKR